MVESPPRTFINSNQIDFWLIVLHVKKIIYLIVKATLLEEQYTIGFKIILIIIKKRETSRSHAFDVQMLTKLTYPLEFEPKLNFTPSFPLPHPFLFP